MVEAVSSAIYLNAT